MAYNTKPIVTDKDGNPISQYYNPETDQYEPVEGSNGANKVLVVNNDLSLHPILEKLNQLVGTVIDEEIRKSNEQTRQSNEQLRIQLYNDLLTELERIEQIDKQVPESVLEAINALRDELGNLESLETADKSSIVNAINEIHSKGIDLTDIENRIGNVEDDLVAHKAESVTHKVSNRKPTATDDETQNIKQGDIWIYENYINEEEYEFIAYQCMDNKAGMAKWGKYVEKVAAPHKIYGVEIDENNSNPETAVVYTDDAVGFTPARGNNGNFDWGSWESIIKEEFQIRPCVLRNLGGGNAEVNYYLDYDDYTKRADGSNSRLDGVDGDVMIEFGVPLWWKFSRVGSKLKIQLSNREFDGAVKYAFEIEDGYNQMPIYPLFLTQIIYLLMFKHLDSQTALGKGRTDADSYTNTGTTNKKTFCYGSTDATDNVKFLGMEDYFGNRRWWIDGCYYDNNRNMLIGKGNFNDTGSGYENFGQAAPSDLGGYIDKVQGGNNTGLIPASTGGSATTYYCDYGVVSAGRLPDFGGSRSATSYSGAFCLFSSTASNSSAHIGGRLFCSRNGKIYIGAYLGVEQNGKLRSISGKESANNKTIGSFRDLARANN